MPHQVSTYPIDHMAPESLIDINGAGDAFVGGFTSRLILGERARSARARTVHAEYPACVRTGGGRSGCCLFSCAGPAITLYCYPSSVQFALSLSLTTENRRLHLSRLE